MKEHKHGCVSVTDVRAAVQQVPLPKIACCRYLPSVPASAKPFLCPQNPFSVPKTWPGHVCWQAPGPASAVLHWPEERDEAWSQATEPLFPAPAPVPPTEPRALPLDAPLKSSCDAHGALCPAPALQLWPLPTPGLPDPSGLPSRPAVCIAPRVGTLGVQLHPPLGVARAEQDRTQAPALGGGLPGDSCPRRPAQPPSRSR